MNLARITVTTCRNCPFSEAELNEGRVYANCYAPAEIHKGKYKIDSYWKNHKLPKFCPLKTCKIIIEHGTRKSK